MKPILEVSQISKKFKIDANKRPYLSLRESISGFFSKKQKKFEEFWALKNVSFNVEQGETLAIIGRNGAGKSTLLKILSKITPPTGGEIISRGRIASLLEVGTGFHPELSGRENVYLNGSILGLTKREINNKFDEIIEFADIAKFLDTPLKHYSSGMQLRLAFAVAANLEPEILIIDEVLAVGDSVFQQKCIQKMTDISNSGRTILFVSHNFSAIRSLCKSAIVLQKGEKVFQGEVEEAINFYNSESKLSGKEINLKGVPRNSHLGELVFHKLIFENENFNFGDPIKFSIQLLSNKKRKFEDLDFGISIRDRNQNSLIHISNRFINEYIDHHDDDESYVFEIESIISPGTYTLTLFLRSKEVIQDWISEMVEFTILDGNPYSYNDSKSIHGQIFPQFQIFKLQKENIIH